MKLGIISVVTTVDEERLYSHRRHIEAHYPEWNVVSRCIPDQPRGVHDEQTHRAAEPKVVALAQAYAREGVDAIYVSCAADPGVELARPRLNGTPILGAGRAGALVALSYGMPVGVLGITDTGPKVVVETLGDTLVAVERPRGVTTALDLGSPAGKSETVAAAGRLVTAGARVILYACTGMSTLGVTPLIWEKYRVPVVDPDLAAAGLLLTLVRHRPRTQGAAAAV
ncbi:MAG TPA: aspartate/glutamate racemase family protein [Limnochordales bacterium]|nr:aspartate/glutamate racemase family protein [Limnochordales bacterium]